MEHKRGFLNPSDYPYPALDFVLEHPAGVLAFPWFGELGRDTLVSLPVLVCARIAANEESSAIRAWAYEVLERWGGWIETAGMIPRVMDQGGAHQWNSADGTLWFCHALAALWALTLGPSEESDGRPELFPDFEERFAHVLSCAIRSIADGRHLFLRLQPSGLLEITEEHASWMEARTGVLAEVNALWFQARFLNFLWGGEEALYDLERLGQQVLELGGADEFLTSLPLAPSVILKDWGSLRADLKNFKQCMISQVSPAKDSNTTFDMENRSRRFRNVEVKFSRILARLWTREPANS